MYNSPRVLEKLTSVVNGKLMIERNMLSCKQLIIKDAAVRIPIVPSRLMRRANRILDLDG